MVGVRPSPLEGTITSALTSAWPGRWFGTRIPARERPAEFARITRTGGDRSNLVQEQPAVLVECYALSNVAAERFAGDVWSTVAGLAEAVEWVHRVELTMPVNFPDPDTTTHTRYQFLASITANLEFTT